MKKLLALSLFVSFAQAHCNTEKPAQAQPNIVKLTEEEKILKDRVVSFWGQNPQYQTFTLSRMLLMGCGFYQMDRKSGYDSDVYPNCPKVLAFLKAYAQEIDTQNKKAAQELVQLLDDQNRRDEIRREKAAKNSHEKI